MYLHNSKGCRNHQSNTESTAWRQNCTVL